MSGNCVSRYFGIVCLLTLQVSMADIEYSYVEAGYEDLELDVGTAEVDGDGLYLAGSRALDDNLFVFGEFRDYDFDPGVDLTLLEAGLGVHSTTSETIQFVGTVGYFIGELDSPLGDDNDDGYDIRLGLRGQPASNFEYELFLGYRSIDSYEANASASLRYNFTPGFSIQAGALVGSDITVVGFGLRASFPR